MINSLTWFSFILIVLFTVAQSQKSTPAPPHWDYQREGPDTWHHAYDQCEGEAQSPINIRTSQVDYRPSIGPLSLNGYNSNMSNMVWNFTHNGHTIVASPIQTNRLSMSGGGLPDAYSLVQFHLHWGYNAYQGSEHTINDQKFPLEIHFVHKSQSTGNLAVLGILFELQRDDNPYLAELLSALNRTVNKTMTFEQQVDISRLFPTSPAPKFYRYNGSLTTPPCTEGVIWTILVRRVPISIQQLRVFTVNSVPINFRPPQRLHSRKVIASFEKPMAEGAEEEGEGGHHSSGFNRRIPWLSLLLCLLAVHLF